MLEIDERDAPLEMQELFEEWLRDDHGNLHPDDDRDVLWEQFIEDHERSQEMSYWRGQYDKEKRNQPVEMPREDMPDKMKLRFDLGLD